MVNCATGTVHFIAASGVPKEMVGILADRLFCFSPCVIRQTAFAFCLAAWEGTRNGELCHRHSSLHRGFGRAKRDGWYSCRPSLLFFSLRYTPNSLRILLGCLGRDPQW